MNGTPAPSQPKKRGCLFYGCLTVAVIAIVGGVALFFGARYVIKTMVAGYTGTTPMPLPSVNLTQTEHDTLKAKIDGFRAALDGKAPAQPLVLSADDINALLAEDPNFRGRAHIEIPGDQIAAAVSLPLDDLPLPGVKGRYLNGTATLKAIIASGHLFVIAETVSVNGKPLPEQVMAGLRGKNLAENAAKDSEIAAMIAKLESLEVRDGHVIITPKSVVERP